MITFFLGTDVKKRQAAFEALLEKAQKKTPALVVSFDEGSWDRPAFENALGTTSFFDEKKLVVLRGLWSRADIARELVDLKETLLGEECEIISIDEALSKELQKKFEKKKGADFFVYDLPAEKKKESAHLFPTAHAFEKGDKKSAWIGLAQLRREGVSGEEFFWVLSWKIKDALSKAPDGERKEKLAAVSRALIGAYHESKRGGAPLDDALETLALSL